MTTIVITPNLLVVSCNVSVYSPLEIMNRISLKHCNVSDKIQVNVHEGILLVTELNIFINVEIILFQYLRQSYYATQCSKK